jgi:ketosteroid isomerase-like protein
MSIELGSERYRGLFDEMYAWAEALCRGEVEVSDAELARFWTADGRMITNGVVEATGTASLRYHFDLFPQKYSRVNVHRPYRYYLEAGDTVVIEYEIVAQVKAGETAIATGETTRQHVRVMAIFTMRDGRIAEMREVAASNLGDA